MYTIGVYFNKYTYITCNYIFTPIVYLHEYTYTGAVYRARIIDKAFLMYTASAVAVYRTHAVTFMAPKIQLAHSFHLLLSSPKHFNNSSLYIYMYINYSSNIYSMTRTCIHVYVPIYIYWMMFYPSTTAALRSVGLSIVIVQSLSTESGFNLIIQLFPFHPKTNENIIYT